MWHPDLIASCLGEGLRKTDCREVRPSQNGYPVYDIISSGEYRVTSLLPLLPVPLWSGVEISVRVPSISLGRSVWKLFIFNKNNGFYINVSKLLVLKIVTGLLSLVTWNYIIACKLDGNNWNLAQSVGTVEYTNCIPTNEYPKQSNGEVPVMLEL